MALSQSWHHWLSSRLTDLVRCSLLTALAVLSVGPLLWLLSTVLKGSEANIFSFPPQLLPSAPTMAKGRSETIANFVSPWQSAAFPRYLWNSTLVAGKE